MLDRPLRYMLFVMLLGSVTAFVGGCGSSNDGTVVEVDEEQEKALTDSMRGYYEENP